MMSENKPTDFHEQPEHAQPACDKEKGGHSPNRGDISGATEWPENKAQGKGRQERPARRNCGGRQATPERGFEEGRVQFGSRRDEAVTNESSKDRIVVHTSSWHLLAASLVVTLAGFIAGWRISPTAFLIFASLYTATAAAARLVGGEHPWMRALAREMAPARVVLVLLMFAMPHIASDAAPWMLSLFGPSALTAAALCGLNDGALIGAVGEVNK